MNAPKRRRKRQPRELTRRRVAEILKVARSTVRRWEGSLLHPRVKPNGVRVFDPEEVRRLAKSQPGSPPVVDEGEMCARAMELFEQGSSVGDVVKALRRPLDWVRRLYAVHCGLGDQLILSAEHRRALESAIGRRLTPDDLVRTVLRMRERTAAAGAGNGAHP